MIRYQSSRNPISRLCDFLNIDYVRDTKAENIRGAKTEKSLIFRPFSNWLQRGLSSIFGVSTTFPTQYVWHDQTPNFFFTAPTMCRDAAVRASDFRVLT